MRPYDSLLQATRYTEEWSTAMEWCSMFPLREKQIVKKFLHGIWPRKLAASLELHELKKFREVKKQFLVSYRESMHAKEMLASTGGAPETSKFAPENSTGAGSAWGNTKNGGSTGGKQNGGKTSFATVAVSTSYVPKPVQLGVGNQGKQTPSSPLPNRSIEKDFSSPIVCHHCGKAGHIRPNCPNRQSPAVAVAATPKPVKVEEKVKLSRVILNRREPNELPTVVLRVGRIAATVDMRGHLDSCSQIDLLPEKWVSVLEGEGCKFYDVPAEHIGWLDKAPRFVATRAVDLTVEVVGWAGDPLAITFYVSPEDFDELIIGWASMKRCLIDDKIKDIVEVQRQLGIFGAYPSRDIDPVFKDIDGEVVVDLLPGLDPIETIPSDSEVEGAGRPYSREARIDDQRTAGRFSRLMGQGVEGGGGLGEPPRKNLMILGQISDVKTEEYVTRETNLGPISESEISHLPIVCPCPMKVDCEKLLLEFADVFDPALPVERADVEPMTIVYRDDFTVVPINAFRRYTPAVQAAMETEVAAQLAAHLIEEAPDAPNPAAVVMVKKPDSATGYRFTVDYKEVNKGIVLEPFPLPNPQDMIDECAKARWKAKLDLRSGYWQFALDPADKDKTAFQVGPRRYRYLVVPMGLSKSAFHVQRQMHKLFYQLIGRGVWIYIDDIVIYADTEVDFLRLLREVLSTLSRSRLRCKGTKCMIGSEVITILGHVITPNGVCMGEERIAAIDAIPFPRTTREVRRFLGMCNYMRRHIQRYAELSKPLSAVVNAPVTEIDTVETRTAFAALKAAVQKQASLSFLRYDLEIFLQVDASIVGVGGTVGNRYPDGDRHCGYCSHAFTDAEGRWKTIEQEAFAIIFCVMFFRSVLWGHPFLLETDHRNLTYIHGGTSPKVVRWSLVLQEFCYAIKHKPGEDNVVADVLSRYPRNLSTATCRDSGVVTKIGDYDNSVPETAASLRHVRVNVRSRTSAVPADVHMLDDFPLAEVPEQDRQALLASVHNSTQGHNGVHRMCGDLRARGKQWRKMAKDAVIFVKSCDLCEKDRLRSEELHIQLGQLGSFELFQELAIDFIGPFPTDELSNSYIFNAMCTFSDFVELVPTEAATAIVAAHCLLGIVARYGCFRYLRSDRGTHFVNEIITEFLRLFEVQRVLTLPERPQANSMIERNGGEAQRHLRAICFDKRIRNIWSRVLPLVQRIINRTFKRRIGTVPNRLVYLCPPDLDRGLFEPFRISTIMPPLTSDYVTQLEATHEILLDITSRHLLEEQKRLAAKHPELVLSDFAVGSYVMVSYVERPPNKLSCRRAGPYEVISREANVFQLRNLTNGEVKPFDISRLSLFIVRPDSDVREIAAADLGESVALEVLTHRGKASKRSEMTFQVRWEDGDVTWEPWEIVRKLQPLDEYIRAHPEARLNSLLTKVVAKDKRPPPRAVIPSPARRIRGHGLTK